MNRKSSGLASLQSGISAGLSAYAAGGPVKHFQSGGSSSRVSRSDYSPDWLDFLADNYGYATPGGMEEIITTGRYDYGVPQSTFGTYGLGAAGGTPVDVYGALQYYGQESPTGVTDEQGQEGHYEYDTVQVGDDGYGGPIFETVKRFVPDPPKPASIPTPDTLEPIRVTAQPINQTVQDYLGLTASEEAARRAGATLYLPQDQYERAQGLDARIAADIAAMTPEQQAAYQDAQVLSPSELLTAVKDYAEAHPITAGLGLTAVAAGAGAALGVPASAIVNTVSGAANLLGVGRDTDTSALEGTPISGLLNILGIGRDTTPTASEQRQISAAQNATNTPEIFVTGSRDFDTSDFMIMDNPFEFTTGFRPAIPGTEYLGDQSGSQAVPEVEDFGEVLGQWIPLETFAPELNLPVTPPTQVVTPTDGGGSVVEDFGEVLGQWIPLETFAPELNLPVTPPTQVVTPTDGGGSVVEDVVEVLGQRIPLETFAPELNLPVTPPTQVVTPTDTGGGPPTEEDTTRIEDIPTVTVPGATPPIISEGGGQADIRAFVPTGRKDWGTFTMPTLGPYRAAPLVQTGTDTSSGMSFQTYAPGAFDDYLARLKQFQRVPQTAGIGGVGYQVLPDEETKMAAGGIASLPEYRAGGIASLPEYRAGGKLLSGPGDGMSDSIPAVIRGKKPQRAALADGEFVVPADVVSHLGNGSTKAGAELLYAMMDKVRQARTGRKRQAPAVKASKFLPA